LSRPTGDSAADGYLTTGQAGKALGVSAQTVKNWVNAGRLRAIRLGGRVLVHRTALASFLETLDQGRQAPEAPWVGLTAGEGGRLARGADEAVPAEKLARLEALDQKMEAGHQLTRAERVEMVALEREVNTAATEGLERFVTARQR